MNIKATRGTGLLENLLAKKRAEIAGRLIGDISRNGKLLDVGCGKFPYFLSNIKFKEKYGIDAQQPSPYKNLYLEKFDASLGVLPYDSEMFDVITMLAFLEHIESKQAFILLKEIYRISKPKCRIIITTPSPIGNNLLKIMSKLNLVSKEEINEHKKIYSLNELERLLASTGFKTIKRGRFEFFLNNYILAQKA